MREIFEQIYRTNAWGSGSGPGSDWRTTEAYRRVLSSIMQCHRFQTVLDVGCGDWQFSKLIDWGSVQYCGVDIVADVIGANRRRFQRPGIEFGLCDALAHELPRAELVLLKDVLQHWTNTEVVEFLPKLRAFQYALITNDVCSNGEIPEDSLTVNADFFADTRCRYRPIDITKPPFSVAAESVLAYRVGGSVKVTVFVRARAWSSAITRIL